METEVGTQPEKLELAEKGKEGRIGHENVLFAKSAPALSSLEYIIRTRFRKGMPENFVAVILREVLQGLDYLNASRNSGHRNLNSKNVSISTQENGGIRVQLVFDEKEDFSRNPEKRTESSYPDIRDLGLMALELAYGSIPNGGIRLLVHNLNDILNVQMEIDGQQEGGRGQENVEELKNFTIRMPRPESFVKNKFVKSMKKGLEAKKKKKDKEKQEQGMQQQKHKNKVAKVVEKIKNGWKKAANFSMDFWLMNMDPTNFSILFWQVVKMCIEDIPGRKYSAAEILRQPFFTVDWETPEFVSTMKEVAPTIEDSQEFESKMKDAATTIQAAAAKNGASTSKS